jgi:thiol-disulfide isomerase/thioredoxin
MPQKLIIILCALVFGMGVAFWGSGAPSDFTANTPATEREEIGNFFFTSLDGEYHALPDFHGKIVFINGWFTRCPACTTEMPELLELAQRHPDDMVFIALSVDRSKADMLRYLERLPEETQALTRLNNVFFVHDEGNLITRTVLNMRGFPQTAIVDREGRQLYKIKGVIDWLGPEMEKIFSR